MIKLDQLLFIWLENDIDKYQDNKISKVDQTPTTKYWYRKPRKTTLHSVKLVNYSVLSNLTITAKEIKFNHHDVLRDVSEQTFQHWLEKELSLLSCHAARKHFC